jgi:hypothetical protein
MMKLGNGKPIDLPALSWPRLLIPDLRGFVSRGFADWTPFDIFLDKHAASSFVTLVEAGNS